MAARPSTLEFKKRWLTMVGTSGLPRDNQEAKRERKIPETEHALRDKPHYQLKLHRYLATCQSINSSMALHS